MASAKTTKAASAAAPEDVVLVRVRILTPVRHDGVDYPESQEVEINSDAADQLVAKGLAELA